MAINIEQLKNDIAKLQLKIANAMTAEINTAKILAPSPNELGAASIEPLNSSLEKIVSNINKFNKYLESYADLNAIKLSAEISNPEESSNQGVQLLLNSQKKEKLLEMLFKQHKRIVKGINAFNEENKLMMEQQVLSPYALQSKKLLEGLIEAPVAAMISECNVWINLLKSHEREYLKSHITYLEEQLTALNSSYNPLAMEGGIGTDASALPNKLFQLTRLKKEIKSLELQQYNIKNLWMEKEGHVNLILQKLASISDTSPVKENAITQLEILNNGLILDYQSYENSVARPMSLTEFKEQSKLFTENLKIKMNEFKLLFESTDLHIAELENNSSTRNVPKNPDLKNSESANFEANLKIVEQALQNGPFRDRETLATPEIKPENFLLLGFNEIKIEINRVFGVNRSGLLDPAAKLIKRNATERFKEFWNNLKASALLTKDVQASTPLNKAPDKLAWYERVALQMDSWGQMSGYATEEEKRVATQNISNGSQGAAPTYNLDDKDWDANFKIFAFKVALEFARAATKLAVLVGRAAWGGVIKGAGKLILGVGAVAVGVIGMGIGSLLMDKNFTLLKWSAKAFTRGMISLAAGVTRLTAGLAAFSTTALLAASVVGLPIAGAISAGVGIVVLSVTAYVTSRERADRVQANIKKTIEIKNTEQPDLAPSISSNKASANKKNVIDIDEKVKSKYDEVLTTANAIQALKLSDDGNPKSGPALTPSFNNRKSLSSKDENLQPSSKKKSKFD